MKYAFKVLPGRLSCVTGLSIVAGIAMAWVVPRLTVPSDRGPVVHRGHCMDIRHSRSRLPRYYWTWSARANGAVSVVIFQSQSAISDAYSVYSVQQKHSVASLDKAGFYSRSSLVDLQRVITSCDKTVYGYSQVHSQVALISHHLKDSTNL